MVIEPTVRRSGEERPFGLPISKRAWRGLGLDDAVSSFPEASEVDRLQWARRTADRLRQHMPNAAAGRLYALDLIGRFVFVLLHRYRVERNGQVFEKALGWLTEKFGPDRLEATSASFRELFLAPDLAGADETGNPSGSPEVSTEERLLEQLLLLWTVNENPAAAPWRPLFDDRELNERTAYRELVESLREFFEGEPGSGPDDSNLFDLLRAPTLAAPDSLESQLRFLLNIGLGEGEALGEQILVGLDVLREEERPVFPGPGGGPPGPGPAKVLEFDALETGEERFTKDRDWMPRLVLAAKNTFVWLHQLSKTYRRSITRLDEIPDDELRQLAGWGFTGLWLIGLWQRSSASQKVKRLCGNPDAASSAYSLDAYRIADELGGEEAMEELRKRAWKQGLRVACDMVPNHMAIDSQWLREKPELFLSLPDSPYPNYRFQGPDLSPDPQIGIYLEDHYYDRSDAAVVFLRLDRRTGERRYVYHGNDGTGMPWNDTAQLDYLRAETRELVIQTILGVARQFPVIRFDAAMTLARRHVHRLWYPEPGSGGDIPSRAGRGLTQAEFDRAMPVEFWREVVDRVAEEAPDTLLLAEAFWLMEGYFVRTLGMHRVYNSAFMNMLRDEDNAGFRKSLKNTLEFRPEILERFVNYVTNPDERTAADQFGTGDKYFAACTLMATLPGLPMFGHGQLEGYQEKYGMEYRRGYSDEESDAGLLERHRRQIVPLLQRRALFGGGASFRLYDLELDDGRVDENVLAFTNSEGESHVLVVVHNHRGQTAGRLHRSVPWRPVGSTGDAPLVREQIGQALGLKAAFGLWRCRDLVSCEERLLEAGALHRVGLRLALGPFQSIVLMDLEEVTEEEQSRWTELAASLEGRPVANLDDALADLSSRPIQRAVARLLASANLAPLLQTLEDGAGARRGELLERAEESLSGSYAELRLLVAEGVEGRENAPSRATEVALARMVRRSLAAALAVLEQRSSQLAALSPTASLPAALLVWVVLRPLGRLGPAAEVAQRTRSLFDAWRLGKGARRSLRELGAREEEAQQAWAGLRLATTLQWWPLDAGEAPIQLLDGWLKLQEVRRFLNVHEHDGVEWFNREGFRDFLWWLLAVAEVGFAVGTGVVDREALEDCRAIVDRLWKAEKPSGYRLAALQKAVESSDCEDGGGGEPLE